MDSLVTTLRSLVSATTTEYTAAGDTWWTDAQLTERLDRRRFYIAGGELEWIPEPVIGGGGSAQYTRGVLNVPGAIEPQATTGGTAADWTMMTASGVVPAGTVTVYHDGHATFDTDQAGLGLEFYGFCYDLHAAAADCLDEWASHLKTAYDFKTDDQQFDRSQAHDMVTARAREMRRQGAPRAAVLTVPDDNPSRPRLGPMTANMRRKYG